ncbi:MAG: NAD-dependent epimerase/dehydratase family protein, partial [Rhodospirillales bacterium]|nr:NAD-dependent epimerase/dehydratase family protein [Rhodospirillales bacterium]
MRKILVTGALGQIGVELVPELRERHGADNVIASGWRRRDVASVVEGGPFEIVDCTEPGDIAAAVEKYEIGTIYHMPAFLSVLGEEKPEEAWALNLGGYANALEVARRNGCAVFFPSSIGAFGPSTPL